MSDLALIWDKTGFGADVALAGGALVGDDGLETAIILSLFCDARAKPDDVLPVAGGDRRGWWGDVFGGAGNDDAIGSRLWLLSREKITGQVLVRARGYAQEALQWLIDDRIVTSLDVIAERIGMAMIGIGVIIARPDGPQRERFDFTWNALERRKRGA